MLGSKDKETINIHNINTRYIVCRYVSHKDWTNQTNQIINHGRAYGTLQSQTYCTIFDIKGTLGEEANNAWYARTLLSVKFPLSRYFWNSTACEVPACVQLVIRWHCHWSRRSELPLPLLYQAPLSPYCLWALCRQLGRHLIIWHWKRCIETVVKQWNINICVK